jgi:4-hydroxy-tetrahydrodipicolinate synthase
MSQSLAVRSASAIKARQRPKATLRTFRDPESMAAALSWPRPAAAEVLNAEKGHARMLLDASAKGVFVIAPTPFQSDGRLDGASTDRMTDFFLEAGCDGMTILGVMGEAPKLDHAESLELSRRIIARRGSAKVIVGVTAPGFAAMRALTRDVMEAGAAGVMIAPPSHLRTDDQVVTYFRQAVEAIGEDIPFVLQDYPQLFQVQMTPTVIRRIVTELPSCVMLKHEDWPGLEKITALRAFQAEGSMRPISILCGNGGILLDFEMERGADGAMTGYAFPDMLVELVRLSAARERDRAHDLFDAHLPLIRYEQQPGVGLAVRKYLLMRRGIIASDTQRRPGSAMSAKACAEVEYLLSRVARFDARARLAPCV